jgi:hypothetical protein
VLEAIRNQKTEEYVKMVKGEVDPSRGHKRSYDEELPSTSSKKVRAQDIT